MTAPSDQPAVARPCLMAPSILSADFTQLGAEIVALDAAGADWIHCDVMDHHFVPNLTFGPAIVKAIRPVTQKPLDVHLMVAPVDPLLPAFIDAGADILSVHPESGPHLHRTIQTIRTAGRKAGVVLNPATPVEAIDYVLDELALVLVMSVNPGFGGQSFLAGQLRKIEAVRARIDSRGLDVLVQVDGGVTVDTAKACRAAGADVLVAGTAAFAGGPSRYQGNISALRGA